MHDENRQTPRTLDYAPPPAEVLPPVPRRLWWVRLFLLTAFALLALFGVWVVYESLTAL